MSFLTATQAELIYSMNPVAGQTQATFTTAALVSPAAASSYQACKLPDPAATWPQGVVQKAFKAVAGGTWGDTGSAPTYQFQLVFDTTQGTKGSIYAGTGAITAPATTVTNGAGGGSWRFECDFTLSAAAMSSGAFSYTVYPTGVCDLYGPANAGGGAITGSSASLTLLSSSVYWLEMWVTCGTSNAANAVTCTTFQLWGLN